MINNPGQTDFYCTTLVPELSWTSKEITISETLQRLDVLRHKKCRPFLLLTMATAPAYRAATVEILITAMLSSSQLDVLTQPGWKITLTPTWTRQSHWVFIRNFTKKLRPKEAWGRARGKRTPTWISRGKSWVMVTTRHHLSLQYGGGPGEGPSLHLGQQNSDREHGRQQQSVWEYQGENC